MVHDRSLFKSLDLNYSDRVRIGNGEYLKVKGKGSVTVRTPTGTKTINDVLYVPDIDVNLVSVGQLIEKKYRIEFKDNLCVIYEPAGIELFAVEMKNRSFSLEWLEPSVYAVNADMLNLWHQRLGHVSFQTLDKMQKAGLVESLPSFHVNNSICEVCQLGKQARSPFPSESTWRAKEKLQLLHADLGGPMRTQSVGGSRYYLLIIDDFSRFSWIYFLKEKSEAAENFMRFKIWVENQTECKIKAIRTDNGTEFVSKKFKEILSTAGIQHQLTVPYSPQQNSVVERKNRTVIEMTRCLLFEKQIPKKLWAEAANTAVYLMNRLPTKAVLKKTPYEAWFGSKPGVSHLKVFGSVCYYWIPEPKREKLDEKAEIGVLVGYSSESKGYRVFNPLLEKVVISRDVRVDESSLWNWDRNAVETFASSSQTMQQQTGAEEHEDENIDDLPVRGTRSLSDVYQRCIVAVLEPENYQNAAKSQVWIDAMKEELRMIEKNETWELTERPNSKHVIGVRWIYKTKLNSDGSVNKYKARLVVKGYAQYSGVDYTETFSPVARFDTIRLIFALAAQNTWKIHQLDVKSAFLNGHLEEEIFIEQPEGFVVQGSEDKVYKLKKALYGLKQAPRAWYARINSYLLDLGFHRSPVEPTLYVNIENDERLIVSVYVDDLLITGSKDALVNKFKNQMRAEFEMSDLGEMHFFLGMEITQSDAGIFICQQKYAKEILKKFQLENARPCNTPLSPGEKLMKEDKADKVNVTVFQSIIGCLLYLTATRPDIMYAASLLSRFMHSPSEIHFKAAKRVLRYIKGTLDYGLFFGKSEKFELIGFTDSDWAGSSDDMRSTSGYVFTCGSAIFSWKSKKQETVAQSSAEAEYIAAAAAVNQALWLKRLMTDFDQGVCNQENAVKLMVDSKSAIAIAKNPVCHSRTKHFKIKFHFVREMVQDGEVSLKYCSTDIQLADIMTKALSKSRFEFLRNEIGCCSHSSKEENVGVVAECMQNA